MVVAVASPSASTPRRRLTCSPRLSCLDGAASRRIGRLRGIIPTGTTATLKARECFCGTVGNLSLPLPFASVEPSPALFRDGAFSCRHELPRALSGLAGNSGHHFGATTARPCGTCGMFRSSFRLLPTRAHAPRRRFAAAMRASPLPAGGSGGLCARLRRARGKRSGLQPIAVPLGKGFGENPLARRCASPCRVNPLPQAARAAPTQGRDLVRAEPRVSVDGSVFKHSQ